MKQIVNNVIPFKGFAAINICGILFVRKKQTSEILLQHEEIHTKQMQELLYLFFYITYLFEWLFRLLFTKDCFSHQAYRNISFEKEAYARQADKGYLEKRKHFAQWRKFRFEHS